MPNCQLEKLLQDNVPGDLYVALWPEEEAIVERSAFSIPANDRYFSFLDYSSDLWSCLGLAFLPEEHLLFGHLIFES